MYASVVSLKAKPESVNELKGWMDRMEDDLKALGCTTVQLIEHA